MIEKHLPEFTNNASISITDFKLVQDVSLLNIAFDKPVILLDTLESRHLLASKHWEGYCILNGVDEQFCLDFHFIFDKETNKLKAVMLLSMKDGAASMDLKLSDFSYTLHKQ